MWHICMFQKCLFFRLCIVSLQNSISEHDYQPDLLEENIRDKDTHFSIRLSKKITLKYMHEVIIRRNQRLILRYYKHKKHLHPEKFGYHLFLLFYLCMRENDLFSSYQTYSGKLLDPKVCAIVNENKQIFEQSIELIDNLLTEMSM